VGALLWWQNLIKGGVAETICATHFNAAGWSVSETGIERIIPSFAQRQRNNLGESNESRIQEYIGHLPDLLVHHPERSYYLVEVKFRANIATPDDLDEFIVELLWQYKNLLFRNYDGHTFKSITFEEWHEPIKGADPKLVDKRSRFKHDLEKGAQRIDPDVIKLPLLFYIVSPSIESGLRVHLACPRVSEETGFTYVACSIHDDSREENNTETLNMLVSELRDSWRADIQPALDCMFPRRASRKINPVEASANVTTMATRTEAQIPVVPVVSGNDVILLSALRSCVDRIIRKAASGRKGAYFPEIIEDVEFWEVLAAHQIRKCSSIEELLLLFSQRGIRVTHFDVTKEDKRHYVELSSLMSPH
jgi:hypothetical protein